MNKVGKNVVTQQMIADAAGVHLSTVSLALRNAPRIPAETKRRIREVADRLGYSPNPLISLLMARVRRRNSDYRGTLAFVHTAPADAPKLKTHQHRNFLAGAKRRARELGYAMDEFFLPNPPQSTRQFAKMLRARGIHGIIVEHLPGPSCPDRRLPFDVTPFAVASLGAPLVFPQLHYVANDQYMRPVLAAKHLLELGYRRLGLVIDEMFDQLMAHRCSAGFWAVQKYTKGIEIVPICQLRQGDSQSLLRWLGRYKPDAVLSTTDFTLLAKKAGLRIPKDIGWVHLDWLPEQRPVAGVYGNSEHTGTAAVELVVSQLHRGEAGPPAHAMNYLVAGSWVDGETIQRIGPGLDLDTTFLGSFTSA